MQMIIPSIYKYIEGILTDRLVKEMNLQIMMKAKEFQGLSYFEDAQFYNNVTFVREQLSWRLVNIVLYTFTIIESLVTAISMSILVGRYNISFPLILIITFIPQCYFTMQVQKETFESTVVNTEDNRKLAYDSEILLTKHMLWKLEC